MRIALAALAAVLGVAAAPADYVASHQQVDGGYAEPAGTSDPTLTAWAVLGLVASGRQASPAALDYLERKPAPDAGALALRIVALRAAGRDAAGDVTRLEAMRGPNGRIGSLTNSTIWGVLALRAAGRPAGTSVRYLLREQSRSGGWSWAPRGQPDSNDTAAAIQALRAADVGRRAKAIRRGVAYLRRLQSHDGGFALTKGRGSDAQSTAWAIQALLAAGRPPGKPAFRYLAGLRRPDGSYRYSKRYVTTPVWVTSQVLPALARRTFPLS